VVPPVRPLHNGGSNLLRNAGEYISIWTALTVYQSTRPLITEEWNFYQHGCEKPQTPLE